MLKSSYCYLVLPLFQPSSSKKTGELHGLSMEAIAKTWARD